MKREHIAHPETKVTNFGKSKISQYMQNEILMILVARNYRS